jgi:hypothetical protein
MSIVTKAIASMTTALKATVLLILVHDWVGSVAAREHKVE